MPDPLPADLHERIASHTWYHTIDLAPGVTTPGYYDLREITKRLPWPDCAGKRCLDVGTFDGFLAFEMEKRGAAEVVAIDVDDYRELDWPAAIRNEAPEKLEKMIGGERGRGFRIAAEALGSRVKRQSLNVYKLTPEAVGKFDVVVLGSVLTHLHRPIEALEAIRTVCSGLFMASESVHAAMTLLHPRRPLVELRGSWDQWSLVNAAGLRRMIEVAGFKIERATRPYSVPYGPAFKRMVRSAGLRGALREVGVKRTAGNVARSGLEFALTGHPGPTHIAVLARPKF